MPLPLLIAILLAFGLDLGDDGGRIVSAPPWLELAGTMVAVNLVGALAFALSNWVELRVDRDGGPTPALRRRFAKACRVLDLLDLGAYGWILFGLHWPATVRQGMGLGGAVLVDEALILLPFLTMQALGWLGLYGAERALFPSRQRRGRLAHAVLCARQTTGLVLPIALVSALGQDVLFRFLPDSATNPWVQIGWMAVMGALVLVLAPAFVRLAWPSRSLPDGPLRERLERLARRHRFRCTDILVWDTGGALVNAGVTGALPWFRYVILTDTMVDRLHPRQIEAVFGHEIGHIAHRHLNAFALFFLGSVGLMALVGQGIDQLVTRLDTMSTWPWTASGPPATVGLVVQWSLFLGFLAIHVLVVFGILSRRFERQADVYGCRSVSCGRPDCPPHADLNAWSGEKPPASTLCPAGIRIFASALSDVATLNGMDRTSRWAWRHGSIARRIAFLEALEDRPEVERRFQRSVFHLRLGLAVALLGLCLLAWSTGALTNLR